MMRFQFRFLPAILLGPALIFALFTPAISGCGGGSSETPRAVESDTVAPNEAPLLTPDPDTTNASAGTQDEKTATADGDSASGFIMPPGDGAPATKGSATEEGFQMPIPEASGSDPGAAATGPAATLQYATWSAIQRQATSTGKVTVVDLWSLACPPCLKEFPGLVQLHRELGNSVVCIGVDVDYDGRKSRPPASYATGIGEFLDSVDATFPNFVSETPSDEVFAEVGIASIPAVLVFDRDGNLVEQFSDVGETAGFTYEADVVPLVRKLAG